MSGPDRSGRRPLRATTRVAGVIGDPVRHSLSPVIHNAAFEALELDWAYLAFEVVGGAGPAAVQAMRALGIDGLSVTMPHKSAVVAELDEVTSVVERLGAANTIVRRGSRLVGDNTDGVGFVDALRLDEGWDPDGRRCVVVGAGGAARAVVDALARAGAADVAVVNRTGTKAAVTAALAPMGRIGSARDALDADLVVNATPLGMRAGVTDLASGGTVMPVDPTVLSSGQLVVDLVYDPLETPWMVAAKARGATVVSGVGMLIHQAAHAFRQWTGEDPPLGAMSAAVVAEISARRGDAQVTSRGRRDTERGS